MSVVVTGLGLVSAIGTSLDECWDAVQDGRVGISETDIIDTSVMITKMAGQAREVPDSGRDGVDRTIEFGLMAAREAAAMAKLAEAGYDPERIGLVVGTCMGASRHAELFHRTWITDGLEKADPNLVAAYPMNGIADAIAEDLGLRGPRTVVSNACAAGGVAIGYALELLWSGAADAVVCGGTDPLSEVSFAGFSSLGGLDEQVCAPYTRSSGLNLGEGSGFLVLERSEALAARGVDALAEVAGYGLSSDAYHPTAPDPSGRGALAAIGDALESAGATAEDIDYINGHGTGTPPNDKSEMRVVKLLREDPPPMSSTKSQIGHTLGAAGAIEAVVTVRAVVDQVMPPTADPQLDDDIHKKGVDIVPGKARPGKIDLALSNNLAFGGNNTSVAFRRIPADIAARPTEAPGGRRDVVITGIDGFVGAAIGRDELMARWHDRSPVYLDSTIEVETLGEVPAGPTPAAAIAKGLNPNYLRKMDPFSRGAAFSAMRVLKTATVNKETAERTGLISATGTGPVDTVGRFHREFVETGVGNSRLFPNTVMNAAAGHVSLLNRFKGPTATICSGSGSAVSALHLAQLIVSRGVTDRVLVVSSDEVSATLLAGYARIPDFFTAGPIRVDEETGTAMSTSSFSVLVEAAETAAPDRVLASIDGFGLVSEPTRIGRLAADGVAWSRSLAQAVETAGWTTGDVDMLVRAAEGRRAVDDPERRAIELAGLGDSATIAPKEIFGDVMGSTAMLSLALACWTAPDDGASALISCYTLGGSYQSMAVRIGGAR